MDTAASRWALAGSSINLAMAAACSRDAATNWNGGMPSCSPSLVAISSVRCLSSRNRMI